MNRNFPGGPVVKKSVSQSRGYRIDPWRTMIPQAREELSPHNTTREKPMSYKEPTCHS